MLAFTPLFVIIAPAFADSVVIIEVELNPSGTDAGNEWIKLFNFDSKPIDLSGWKVLTDDGGAYAISNLTLSACTETIIFFSSQFLYNRQEILTRIKIWLIKLLQLLILTMMVRHGASLCLL